MIVNPQRLHRHIRVCQSLIDRLAPQERGAWNPIIGRNPDIPVMNLNQMIAASWVNLARINPDVSYQEIAQAFLTWGADRSCDDPQSTAHAPHEARPASPLPPPQSPS